MILSIANRKGGCAKSTTAVSLAAGLVRRKRRALLIDLDSQASASLSIGIDKTQLTPSAADVLLHHAPVHRSIRKTSVEGLDVMTGSTELANADSHLAREKDRHHRLRSVLRSIDSEYDAIVIDTPPSLGLLSINALTAADHTIIPTTAQYLALEGLAGMMNAIDKVRSGIDPSVSVLGILLTIVDRRMKSTGAIIDMIRGHYGKQVFRTEIRINVKLAEAPSYGQDIFAFDPSSTGAACYDAWTDEVLRIIKKQSKD